MSTEPSTSGPSVAAESAVTAIYDQDHPTVARVLVREGSAITKLPDPLGENNWMAWRERMRRVLRLCGVEAYVDGAVPIPQGTTSLANWVYNDNYAQVIITNNVASPEMLFVTKCDTARTMWKSLEDIHESRVTRL